MVFNKLILFLIWQYFKPAISVNLECSDNIDRFYHPLLYRLDQQFVENGYFCHFKASDNSSEMNINIEHKFNWTDDDVLTIIYATQSIPILPAELYKKFSNINSCIFFGIQNFQVHRDWFKSSQDLKRILFSNNNIPNLDGGIFEDLENLEYLSFVDNRIQKIDDNAFAGLKKLQKLKFYNNKMELNLNSEIFKDLISLKYLWIQFVTVKMLSSNFLQNLVNLWPPWRRGSGRGRRLWGPGFESR